MNAVAQLSVPIDPAPEPALVHAALEACSQGLAISEHGRILFANAAFARQLGFFHGSDLRGYSLSALPLNPDFDTGPQVFSHNGNLLQIGVTRLPVAERDVLLLTAKQESRVAQAPLPNAGQMESLGRLVSGVAHDFNNLLTGILLYCELLQRALVGDRRLTRYLDEMRGAGEQAATLIQQLLDVARKHVPEPVALSWNDEVEKLRNLLRRLIGENIQLICDLEPGLGLVRMRPAQMPQVILNLALNARDAMQGGGKLILASHNRETHVDFTVSDTGCGMDEATRARLLESSFTTKPPGQGNGLGLATVRRIAQEQKGSFHLDSAPGRGTRVSLRLPRVRETDLIRKGNSL